MLIVISNPEPLEGESELIEALFEEGMTVLHMRKPGIAREEYIKILKNINPVHKKKVVLHQYHDLAAKYNIKGLHMNEKGREEMNPKDLKELSKELRGKNLTFSSSFHIQDSISLFDGIFNYAFLSPVFTSISKTDYKANVVLHKPEALKITKVIALGGLNGSNIETAAQKGFDGVAVLGAIWTEPSTAVENFVSIRKEYAKVFKS